MGSHKRKKRKQVNMVLLKDGSLGQEKEEAFERTSFHRLVTEVSERCLAGWWRPSECSLSVSRSQTGEDVKTITQAAPVPPILPRDPA